MSRTARSTDKTLLGTPDSPFIHRDLSWIFFNERVLGEAKDSTNPLLERLKFLAISSGNLDEFFMIRFSSVGRNLERIKDKDEILSKKFAAIQKNMTSEITSFVSSQDAVLNELTSELKSTGIHLILSPQKDDPFYQEAQEVFEAEVLQKLPPPELFAYSQVQLLENLQLGIVLNSQSWIRIPKSTPLLLRYKESPTYFLLDDLIQTFLQQALKLDTPPLIIRLTRDGDVSIEITNKDTASIPDAVITGLKRRDGGKPVRLQYINPAQTTPEIATTHRTIEHIDNIAKALKIDSNVCFGSAHSILLHSLWGLIHHHAPLLYPPQQGYIPPVLREIEPQKIFDTLKNKDILLHHPYDSFESYINLIKAACADPDVISIEQTIYRMDAISPLLDFLKAAATTKKIRVLIELRARFDEYNNLRLAETLRQAGVDVHFGFGKLKLHAKVALITRLENGLEKRYTHLSTGNYKASTAKQYTDIAIITSHAGIGTDARKFFDAVSVGAMPTHFDYLVHAPAKLHRRLIAHIKAETEAAKKGKPARIFAKVNALVDEGVVQQLYLASQAGVRVDLVVRGACGLVPGLKGISENIAVYSIIDKYLEHSRIYYFENSGTIYLSSADWMPRNFFSRLELAFPVLSPRLHHYIRDVIIPTYLLDNVKAWTLRSDCTWERTTSSIGQKHRAQLEFEALTASEYQGTVLSSSSTAALQENRGSQDYLELEKLIPETNPTESDSAF